MESYQEFLNSDIVSTTQEADQILKAFPNQKIIVADYSIASSFWIHETLERHPHLQFVFVSQNNGKNQIIGELKEAIQKLETRVKKAETHNQEHFNEWINILMQEGLLKMKQSEKSKNCLLIIGEIGSGKSSIAKRIHTDLFNNNAPWITLNCMTLPKNLQEIELWGHEKGFIVGTPEHLKRGLLEIASRGSLLLEEISELDLQAQEKLMQDLKRKKTSRLGGQTEIDCEIFLFATSSHNLEKLVEAGKFREDLYQFLYQDSIQIPSLRTKKNSILPLSLQCARRIFQNVGKSFVGFTTSAEKIILSYGWPGNVLELWNILQRASLTVTSGEPIGIQTLGLPTPQLQLVQSTTTHFTANTSTHLSLTELKKNYSDHFERDYLINSLKQHYGNVSAASRAAKLDRSNFLRLLRKHSIKAAEYRKQEAHSYGSTTLAA